LQQKIEIISSFSTEVKGFFIILFVLFDFYPELFHFCRISLLREHDWSWFAAALKNEQECSARKITVFWRAKLSDRVEELKIFNSWPQYLAGILAESLQDELEGVHTQLMNMRNKSNAERKT
jgi:hypothetical protein